MALQSFFVSSFQNPLKIVSPILENIMYFCKAKTNTDE